MNKDEVVEILEELRYSFVSVINDGNSKYDLYSNEDPKFDVYLGGYYIEIVHQPTAYAYKDAYATKEDLLNFLT